MKAAVLEVVPGGLEIEDVDVGEPGPREVVVRTVAAGLCHTDLHFMEGKYPFPLPVVLGHESAGCGSCRVNGPLCGAWGPCDHLLVGVLRSLRAMHERPLVSV